MDLAAITTYLQMGWALHSSTIMMRDGLFPSTFDPSLHCPYKGGLPGICKISRAGIIAPSPPMILLFAGVRSNPEFAKSADYQKETKKALNTCGLYEGSQCDSVMLLRKSIKSASLPAAFPYVVR